MQREPRIRPKRCDTRSNSVIECRDDRNRPLIPAPISATLCARFQTGFATLGARARWAAPTAWAYVFHCKWLLLSHCWCVGRTTSPPCPHSDAAGNPADGLRHCARPAYQQLKAQLSGEIASQQVHIERLQGAIKVVVSSRVAVSVGRLADAAQGGGDDCEDGTDPGVPSPGAH